MKRPGRIYHTPIYPKSRERRTARLSALSAGAFLAAPLFLGAALAHDALPTAAQPQGWKYPFSCCSGYDCRPVSAASISEHKDGYVINATGEVVSYTDKRIRQSKDDEYHWCSKGGSDTGSTICLFVPPHMF